MASAAGGASSGPSSAAVRWLIAIRLVVVSTLLVGALIVQVVSRQILPLAGLYGAALAAYALSLGYAVLHLTRVATSTQAAIQLLGDLAVITAIVYLTGGLYSPFSFLYVAVIVAAALLLRRGVLVFAGLAALVYGVMVDLMVFHVLPVPPNLVGDRLLLPTSRVLYQLFLNIVGFLLVALLVSHLAESTRRMRDTLEVERRRRQQLGALADHLVRSVDAGLMALDLDARILHLNPAGARILGTTPEDAAGRPVEEVMPLATLRWGLLLARSRSRPVARLQDTVRRSGVAVGLTVGPLGDENGQQVGFVVTFQDLAEAEREAERRRVQERMAAVGELAARMAHEIRNPLASISGAAQVLSGTGAGPSTQRRLADIVVRESQRLSRILQDFLDFARTDGREAERVDLAAVVRECVELLRRSPEVRPEHEIVVKLPERLEVPGEEASLRQVVWNLARNAVQAMPDGGRLTISGGSEAPGTAVLRFADTGHGMEEAVRRRAFEPFVTTRPGGTGLGLAVVYSCVARHRGTVEIDSEPGEGTVVTVRLPTGEGSGER